MFQHVLARLALVLVTIIAVSACTPTLIVNVNAITEPDISGYGTRYYLTNRNADAANDDLYFQEFRRYFDHILQKQGFTRVDAREKADIEIQFHYGVSDGRTGIQSYSWPIYETFGGESVTVTEKITDSGGQTRTVQRTVYMPAYVRQVGSSYETRSFTIYNRYVNLAALPVKTDSDKSVTPIWNINIYSVGESSDLRAIMPFLAAACMPFIARNSGQQQSVTLRNDDPLVMELRNLVTTTK